MAEEKQDEEEVEKEVAATLFIASAKCNGILSFFLSPRNRVHALAAVHSAS